jgi:flagellin FlaB
MILVAGATASILIQMASTMQEQAMKTGDETIRDVSSGLQVTHISGYNNGSTLSQLAIFLTTTAGSNDIDLTYTYVTLSDTIQQVILTYNSSSYSRGATNGLFGTLNTSNISSSSYGLIVIRDIDTSCSSSNPVINGDDLVALLVDTGDCFSGISTRTEVLGRVTPEAGINGVISFTTPSAYVHTILDL